MRELAPFDRLVEALSRLPGVGRRSAERMAVTLARRKEDVARPLIRALQEVEQSIVSCRFCGALTAATENPCRLCTDPRRNPRLLCVVEDPGDILTIERSGGFNGHYYALMGRLSPIRGEGFHNTRIDALVDRVGREKIEEVILALNTDVEGDSTASYLQEALKSMPVRITHPARGIPAGSGLAYTDNVTLARALSNRQEW